MRQARRDFRHSLRLRLLIVILLIWLIPTVVLSHFISVLLPQLHRMSEDSLRSEAEYAFSQTEDSLEGLISLSRDATYDGELASAWERRQQGALGDAEFVRLSRNYLERKYSRVSLIRCAVFAPDLEGGLFLFPPADAAEAAVYREEVHGEVLALRESLDTRCGFLRASDRIWLIRGLYNTQLQPFGVLALEIDGDALFSPLSAVAEKWGAEAALRLDRVQTGSGPLEEAREGLTDPGGDTLIYSRVSASRDWDLAWRLTLPRERLYGREQQFRRLYLGLCLLLIPVLGLVALYTYRRFSRPVSLLVGAAHRIEAGGIRRRGSHAGGGRAGGPGPGLFRHEHPPEGAGGPDLQGGNRPAGRPDPGAAEPDQPAFHQQRPGGYQLAGPHGRQPERQPHGGGPERAAQRHHGRSGTGGLSPSGRSSPWRMPTPSLSGSVSATG